MQDTKIKNKIILESWVWSFEEGVGGLHMREVRVLLAVLLYPWGIFTFYLLLALVLCLVIFSYILFIVSYV